MSTKQSLIENYLFLGTEKGFDNVSLQNLADSTGIRKASIFSHFVDFADLKKQAVDFCLESLETMDFEINPKSENAETLFLNLINSFIDAFSLFPQNALMCMIDQKKTYDDTMRALSNRINLMINSRFQVALDYCYQRSWTEMKNTEDISGLLTSYFRNILIKKNMSDDDLSDMLEIILNLL